MGKGRPLSWVGYAAEHAHAQPAIAIKQQLTADSKDGGQASQSSDFERLRQPSNLIFCLCLSWGSTVRHMGLMSVSDGGRQRLLEQGSALKGDLDQLVDKITW